MEKCEEIGFQFNFGGQKPILFSNLKEEILNEWIYYFNQILEKRKHPEIESLSSLSKINFNDLQFDYGNKLGQGGFGIVLKGIWMKSNQVAIKMMNLSQFMDQKEKEEFIKEFQLTCDLKHPNIVKTFGISVNNKGEIAIVMEFISGGDLSKTIRNKEIEINEEIYLKTNLSISSGMNYLHSIGLIHRDLKPQNILVENLKEGKVKICDFGLTKLQENEFNSKSQTLNVGTPAYCAPEVSQKGYSNKIDIYSFSFILWEMETRELGWSNLEGGWKQILIEVDKGKRPSLEKIKIEWKKQMISKSWNHQSKSKTKFFGNN